MGLFSKVQQVRQEIKDTKIPAPDGSWVKTRAEYKAAEKRVKGK